MLHRSLAAALLALAPLVGACSSAEADDPILPSNDPFPFRGTYAWTFEIPGYGTQVSSNVFEADQVVYEMEGAAYSTRYTIDRESYDAEEGRWVGKTGNSVYYVMFFKDVTASSVSIYKHQCEARETCYLMARPAADVTADHGWNTYNKVVAN